MANGGLNGRNSMYSEYEDHFSYCYHMIEFDQSEDLKHEKDRHWYMIGHFNI